MLSVVLVVNGKYGQMSGWTNDRQQPHYRCHAMDIIIIDERPSVVGNSSNMIPNKTWYAGGTQGSVERLHREKDRGWVETCKMKFQNPKKQTPKISISSISLGISGSSHSIISQPLAPSLLEGGYLSLGFVSLIWLCARIEVSGYRKT